MTGKKCCFMMVAAVALTTSGCVAKRVEGTISTYTMDWWVGPGCILGGVLAIAAGVFFLTKKQLYRSAILSLMGIALCWISIDQFTTYLTISDADLVMSDGSWFSRSTIRVKFNQLDSVEVRRTESRARYGRVREHLSLLCRVRERSPVKVPILDLGRAALPEILSNLEKRKIPVQGIELLSSALE